MSKTKLLMGLMLLAAVGAGLGFWWPFGNGDKSLRLPGVVEIREVRLGSKLGGRVKEVHVNEGDVIRAGQLLLVLDAPEVKAQLEQYQAKLAAADWTVKRAENGPRTLERTAALAALDAAKAKLKRIKDGDREEDRRVARAEVETAQAELRLAEEEFNRTDRTARAGAGTAADVDNARAVRTRAEAKLALVKARLERTEKGRTEEISEAENEVKRLDAEYRLLEEGTRYEDKEIARANVDELRGKIAELQANLAEAEVRAPGDPKKDTNWKATVEVLAVRRGDVVSPNTPLLRILSSEDKWVKVYVPETKLGQVRMNQEVEVTVDSYPGKRFKGKVIHVQGESEFTPRNVQSADERRHQVFGVKVRVDDPEGVFKSGMAAEVFLPLATD